MRRSGLAAVALLALAAGKAGAAISTQQPFTSVYAGTAFPGSYGYTVSDGTARMLVVGVSSTIGSAATQSCTVTYGGRTLTLATGDGTTSAQQHTWLFYLKDTPAVMTGTPQSLVVGVSGGTARRNYVYAAVFAGVDQSAPIAGAQSFNGGATSSTTVGPFGTALAVGTGERAIELVNLTTTGATAGRQISPWATGWSSVLGPNSASDYTNTMGFSAYAAQDTTPGSTTSQHTANGAALSSMAAMSIRVAPTTTVGDGTDPTPAVTLAPGGRTTMLDAFTLQTEAGTDTVTSATVTLAPANAFQNVAFVEITSDGGGLLYGSTASPTSNTVVVDLGGTSITATTTQTQYKVRITPDSHAAMPAPPGASYATTGTVTAITSANPKVYSDAGSNTVTIDNASPANPTLGTVTPGDSAVSLEWTNPPDADFAEVVILRSTASVADVPTEGATYVAGSTVGASTVAYAGNLQAFTDPGLSNGTGYFYELFARDTNGNYSSGGVQTGPHTPALISRPSGWAQQYAGTAFPNGTVNASYAVAPGPDRLLVVAVASTRTTAGVVSCSATYGGQALTLAAGDGTSIATWNHSFLLYLKDTPAVMDGTGRPLAVTCSGGSGYYTWVHAAVYGGVDQTAPISDAESYNNASGDTAVGPFSPALSVGAGEQAIEVVNLASTGSSTNARTVSIWASGWTTAGVQPASVTTFGPTATMYVRDRAVPTAATADGSQHTANANAWDSMTALSLKAGPTVTTVGNGVDPSPAATIGPGGAATTLDAFTLRTNRGTDAVTAATVTLAPADAFANVALVEITNDAGTVVYGSVANPASSTVAVDLATHVNATMTLTQYKVRITPYAHAAMPPPPGASYDVTGTVTAITSTNPKVYSDGGSNTVTIDNRSPANVTMGAVTAGDARVVLGWTSPPDADFSEAVVLRSTASVADVPAEGASYAQGGTVGASVVRYVGNLQAFTDTAVVNGTSYWYRIFAKDTRGNYSQAGVEAGPRTPLAPVAPVTPGTPAATASSCSTVTVTAPYAGDFYTSNSTTSFARSLLADGPWTPVCGDVTGASPRTCVDTAAFTERVQYYQVSFTDPDGVAGANPRVVAATTPRCGFTITVASGGPVTATTPAPGDAGVVVGRIGVRVTSGAGPVLLTSLAVRNTGTALAATDVQSLLLYDDRGTAGTLDGADVLLGAADWDGSRYVFSGLAYSVSATGNDLLLAVAVAGGAIGGRTFTVSVASSDAGVVFPDLVTGSYASATGATITAPVAATEGDVTPSSTKPLVAILNPSAGQVVSGTFRVQVKTWVPGTVAVTNLQLSQDNGRTWTAYTFDLTADQVPSTANYDPDVAHATVFEKQLALAPGSYGLKARASNDGGATWVASGTETTTVLGAAKGDGNLLVRDNSSQLCTDCHAVKTHSSQTVGTRYGQWATSCRDCHAPHGTRNIGLVRETITPPAVTSTYQPSRAVYYSNETGAVSVSGATSRALASLANEGDNTGPCQVCHTRTGGATPRWRNTGNSDAEHYSTTGTSGVGTCTGCHAHSKGFLAPESKGNERCRNCHPKIANAMAGNPAASPPAPALASKHSLLGFTDGFTDSGVSWGSLQTLSAITSAQRSCVNMCHVDHVHGQPGQTITPTHAYNVATNAADAAGRSVTRSAQTDPTAADYRLITGPAGATSRTDFDDAAASKGLCVSCHARPVSATKPAIPAASYAVSAHNSVATSDGTTIYAWRYAMHDGSTFDRNCTKCHASRKEGTTPASAGVLSAVHGTDDPSLLSGATNPAGSAAGFVCYNCHGAAASPAAGAQGDRSTKDIQSQLEKTSKHPAIADAVHDSAAESTSAAFGNALGGAGRHASCIDCHDPHDARAGTHAVATNLAGPPLEGAWGAQLSTSPAFWTNPTSASFTKRAIVGGSDVEATLCFKCHSSFYGTLPSSPSGGFVETDTAKEFNPNNAGAWYSAGTANAWSSGETAGGFHPVLATAGNNLGAVDLANLATGGWRTAGARNLMTCTDCHESNAAADPNGPHGSSAGFILRGPNTAWNASVLNGSSIPLGTFCVNCHSRTFASSRFPDHGAGEHSGVPCFNCHAAIPHGGPRPGILNPAAGVGTGVPAAAGWDGTAPYWQGTGTNRLYIVSYPSNATTSWAQGDCGCDGSNH